MAGAIKEEEKRQPKFYPKFWSNLKDEPKLSSNKIQSNKKLTQLAKELQSEKEKFLHYVTWPNLGNTKPTSTIH